MAMSIRVIFSRFWPLTRPYRGRLLLSLALVVVGPFLDTAQIWVFKLLIDDVVVPRSFAAFPVIAGAYLGIGLAQGVGSLCDEWLSTWLGERFVLDLRTRVFDHLHRLSVSFFDRRPLGDTLSRLTGDIDAIEALVVSGLTRTLAYGCEIVLFTGALVYLNWRLALASLLAAPVFLLAARYFSARLTEASRQRRARSGSLTAIAEESLGNVALIQAYDRHTAATERFHRENLGQFTAEMTATRLEAMFAPLVELLEILGVVLVIGVGVWALRRDQITLGGLLVFLTYLGKLYRPVRGAGRLSTTVSAARASAERLIELLEQQPTVREPAHPRPLPAPQRDSVHGRDRVQRGVVFTNVGFRYPGAARPALEEISFTLAPGEKVALVGASGAGKSTLGALLLRLHDPDTGHITLDGCDLRELGLTSLRHTVSAVLQEALVFDGSIRENILWGKPDATNAELLAAAEAADAHEFITALPEGYQTRIGQRGRLLSGGQRQRVALARAIIRDAPVVLLDEPTTGLDAAATQRVLAPMRALMTGRTTLIISHNLLTVTDADRILYLDGGRITGAGTHHELLTTHPRYARLHQLHYPSHTPTRARQRLQPELI